MVFSRPPQRFSVTAPSDNIIINERSGDWHHVGSRKGHTPRRWLPNALQQRLETQGPDCWWCLGSIRLVLVKSLHRLPVQASSWPRYCIHIYTMATTLRYGLNQSSTIGSRISPRFELRRTLPRRASSCIPQDPTWTPINRLGNRNPLELKALNDTMGPEGLVRNPVIKEP